jgi:uncharacterized paraquat-inducible protein A
MNYIPEDRTLHTEFFFHMAAYSMHDITSNMYQTTFIITVLLLLLFLLLLPLLLLLLMLLLLLANGFKYHSDTFTKHLKA